MVAPISNRDFCAAEPEPLFYGLEQNLWDVSPAGDFYISVAAREPPRLNLYLNWVEELKRLVPVD